MEEKKPTDAAEAASEDAAVPLSWVSKLKYPHPLLVAHETGAVLDLRVRVAMNLLSSPAAAEVVVGERDPEKAGKAVAIFALEAAKHLIMFAEDQNLIEEMPGFFPELDEQERLQAIRMGSMQVESNAGAAAYGKHMAGKQGPTLAVAKNRPIILGAGGDKRRP